MAIGILVISESYVICYSGQYEMLFIFMVYFFYRENNITISKTNATEILKKIQKFWKLFSYGSPSKIVNYAFCFHVIMQYIICSKITNVFDLPDIL